MITETIYQTLIHTPWWVYVIFVVLIQLGFKASKTSIVFLPKLAIAPTIFSYMAIESLINNLQLNLHILALFSSTFLFGMVMGYIPNTFQSARF